MKATVDIIMVIINVSDAINIFARKVVSEQAIPFEVKLKNYKEES